MLTKAAFLSVLMLVVVVGVVGAAYEPARPNLAKRAPRGVALPYNGRACPDGYWMGRMSLRPSSRENPLDPRDPKSGWMWVCTPKPTWSERVVGSVRRSFL